MMMGDDRPTGNRDESFADPRITSARQSPIIRLALSYETIRAFDFYYAPQDRDLITSMECSVDRKVSYRIDILFVMMGPETLPWAAINSVLFTEKYM